VAPGSSGAPSRGAWPGSALLGILLCLPAFAGEPPAEVGVPPVIVLSLDGVRHDYPGRIAGAGFSRLVREGVSAGRLIPSFPASTLPAHVTLATGCFAERHGILNRRFLDDHRGEFDPSASPDWIGCEPIWITAERQGLRSAVENWTGSFGAWGGREASFHEREFVPLADREVLNRVFRWMEMPVGSRPRLVLAYLSGADHEGHRDGPDSAEVEAKVRRLDGQLADLERRLERTRPWPPNLIVVSDHGMAVRKGQIDPAELLARQGIGNRTFCSGGSANVYLRKIRALPEAVRILSEVPGLRIFTSGEMPEDLHYGYPGRTGDIVLLAPVGTELVPYRSRFSPDHGVHGYLGSEESMGGIFFGWGPSFRRGTRIPDFRAVDLYPLVCALLGIQASPRSQGELREELLKRPERGSRSLPPPGVPERSSDRP
jgi:predicted AlkP superfamily pyrophosphatase or phosphodiesterase